MRTVLLASLLACATALAQDKPNIVLVLADDLGINDLSCYGRKDQPTPNLDALAAGGLRYSSATCAQPICSPSRAALLTGKTPARLHITNYLPGRADAPTQKLLQPIIEGQLPTEETTLAEVLKTAGYATGIFGKWHLGGKAHGPAAQGFDTVVDAPGNSKPSATEGGKSEYALTAAAEKFMEENKDKPFLCYVPHHNPHIPIGAKPELVAKHAGAFHPEYAAMIETLDDAVGRLVRKVESLGLTQRTVFIFTSDNGGLHVLEFPGTPATHNTPFRAGKGYLHEGGLRVPLIVSWAGKIKPGVTDEPVVLTDLMPTLMTLAGLDVAKTTGPLDGVSLAKAWLGQEAPKPRTLFWHFPHYTNQGGRPGGAVREGNWKLIESYEDGALELYDLGKDIGETINLAAAEKAKAEELRGKLAQWRKRVGAQENRPNPEFDAAAHAKLYVDPDPTKLKAKETAAATEPAWKEWRQGINAAVKGNKPRVTAPAGDIRLQARDAKPHGEKIQYEPQPHKNTVGFWVNPADWVEWEFEVAKPGRYLVQILQGCGGGGSEVEITAGTTTLPYTVQDTGHFQNFILRDVGEAELAAGKQTLSIKPKVKKGGAVMDVRQVLLRPVE